MSSRANLGGEKGGKSIGNPAREIAEVPPHSEHPPLHWRGFRRAPILLHCCTASDAKPRLSERNWDSSSLLKAACQTAFPISIMQPIWSLSFVGGEKKSQLGFIYVLLIATSQSVVLNNSYKGRGGGGVRGERGAARGEKGIGCVKINSCILIADCLGRDHLALELWKRRLTTKSCRLSE